MDRMPDLSALSMAIATFEEIARRNRDEPEVLSPAVRRQQLADRRLAFATMAQLGEAGRLALSGPGNEALLGKFEQCLANFRHVLALHQANWPVVSIEPGDPDYLRSRQSVGFARRQLAEIVSRFPASAI
jgi:hypothetical protein